MRLSKAGLILGGAYLALAAALLFASTLTDDDKGAYVLRQLSVWPGLVLLIGLGLEDLLLDSWLNSVPALLLLNLALAYGLGWAAGRLRTLVRPRRDS